MRFFNEKNIGKIVFTSSIILVGIISIVFSIFFVTDTRQELADELPKIEKEFIQQQQALLHNAVSLQMNQIDFRRVQIHERLKGILKSRVNEARAISLNLHNKNVSHKSQMDIEDLVRESIRPIRFNQRNDYFFAFDLDGTVQLYPPDPSLEGKNITQAFDWKKLQIIRMLTAYVEKHYQGFQEYDWPLPNAKTEKISKKISYVALLEPFNWFIGSGAYYADYAETIKEEILRDIEKSMGDNPEDYFFIYQLHDIHGGEEFATLLVNPNRPDLVGTKISDSYRGAHGKQFRKEFLKGLRAKGEAYVTYWYKKPGDTEPKPKMSYFKLYPEWNWVVAKGVYLDDLKAIILKKEQALETRLQKRLKNFVFLFLIALVVVVLLARLFTHSIYGIFQEYKEVQEQQRNELERVNAHLQELAIIDSLTKLYNRHYFNTCLNNEMVRSVRYNSQLSLVIFDIDQFKNINDTLGHLSGDEVLRELAHLVRINIRNTDILARWGGDEFVLLVLEADKDVSVSIADKLCSLISHHTFPIDRVLNCSFGVTVYIPGEEATTFIDRADQALYKAKKGGRHRIVAC